MGEVRQGAAAAWTPWRRPGWRVRPFPWLLPSLLQGPTRPDIQSGAADVWLSGRVGLPSFPGTNGSYLKGRLEKHMPEDTVRGLRINLISVKDHSKYFFGGASGASSSPWLGRKWGWRWSSAVMCVGCGGPGEARWSPGPALRGAETPAWTLAGRLIPGFSCQKERKD